MRIGRWIGIVGLCLAALWGCTKQKELSHVLRMNINREPLTMDPRSGSESVGSTLHFILFEGLMRLNPDGSLTPAQAKSVEISDDRKTYTFHLRKTKWSDGTAVTAADFEMAWKKILSPDFPAANAPLLYPIKNAEKAKRGAVSLDQIGVRSLDEKTLQVELESPTPYFLDLVSFCVFFPIPHRVDKNHPRWMDEAGPQFISNGPFKLAQWKHHNEIVLEKNLLYWEAPQIDLDKIQISMVSDENTALNMFENNEIDLMGLGISPIPNDVLLQYHQRGLLKTHTSPATSVICFNIAKFPFDNKNIRQAFAYAINRKEIVENITQLGEEEATNVISPRLRNNHTLSYFKDDDVKEAQRLFLIGLKELGITQDEFPHLTYYYSHGDLNHRLAQTLQQQWETALRIKITLEHSEHKIFLDRLKNRNYEIAQSFWIAQYNDPMNILERFKYKTNPKNYPGWENREYIRLLEKTAFELVPEERLKIFEKAEALLMEEMPFAPLYHWKSSFIIKDHLKYQEYRHNGVVELTRISYKD